jgi:subtilisin-like proprotein convertase family protein
LDTTRSNIGSVLDTPHDLCIGRDREGSSPAYGFKGRLDEVRMWNRVLTQTEINENKHLSLALNNDAAAYKGLILNIPFQQSGIFSVQDQSSFTIVLSGSDVTPAPQPFTAADYLSYNSALKLNGTNAYVAVAHDTLVSVANTPFTIEAWVYRNASQLGTIYSKHNQAYNKGLTIAINGAGNLSCKINNSTWNSTGLLSVSRWNHIAVTFDGTTYSYYINGVLDKTFAIPAVEYVADSAFVGRRILGDAFFNGLIDEVRMLKKAKNVIQIREGMFRGNNSDSGYVLSFEGNLNGGTVSGQLFGGAMFSSTANVGVPVSPVLPQLPNTISIQPAGVAISKNAPIYKGSIAVDRPLVVNDVKVFVSMEHSNMAHVGIRLISPLGDTVVLAQNMAATNPVYMSTVFDANAIPMSAARLSYAPAISPQQSLATLFKRINTGNWKLEVTSTDSSDVGVIHGWGIGIAGTEVVPTIYKSHASKTVSVKGYSPTIDSVMLSGAFLTQEITLTLEAPFSIQLPGNAGFVQQLVLPLSGDSIPVRSIVIRYNPNSGVSHQSFLKITSSEINDSIGLFGWVKLPTLQLDIDTVPPFSVMKLNNTSAERELILQGFFLEDSVDIKVKGPFEVSLTSGSGFDSSLVVPVTQDTLKPMSIFLRYRPVSGTQHQSSLVVTSGNVTRTLYLSGSVGISSGVESILVHSTVNCYPNPATDKVVVETAEPITRLIVTDLNGRIVQTTETPTVDVSEMKNGLYVLNVETLNGVKTLKITVAH